MSLRLALLLVLAPPVTAQVSNSGLAAVPTNLGVRVTADLLAFSVSEIQQGADLDGDGDAFSWVLYVKAGESGSVENLHLPVPFVTTPVNTAPFAVSERLVAFVVAENELASTVNPAGTDLNGDGDVLDRVLHVWDRNTHQIANTHLAGITLPNGLAVVGDSVAFGVLESAQGQDLDGDGVLNSTVACTWTAPGTLRVTTVPISVAGMLPSVAIAGGRAYFREHEASSHADRNGDLDMQDDVLQEMDLASGTITNLGLECDDLVAGGPILAFRVGESEQGATDLNGDGDTSDRIEHVRIAVIGATRNLGVPVRTNTGLSTRTTIGGHLIALRCRESIVPPVDLNGDGDVFDDVLFVHDARANMTWNTHAAVLPESNLTPRAFLVDGTSVLFAVAESIQGTADLNGDGDINDRVVHVFSTATGLLTNLGLASGNGNDGYRASAEWFVFPVDEMQQGNQDLDGDGFTSTHVLHAWERSTGLVQNFGLGTTSAIDVVLNGRNLLFTSFELYTGDLNGDGDAHDHVLRRRDGATGVVTNMGLAPAVNGSQAALVAQGTIGVALVSEASQNVDLDGDGDLADNVLHFVRN